MNSPKPDRNYWDDKLKEYFPGYFIDNFTDFNDSECYTYFIGTDETRFGLGSKDLRDFLFAGNDAYYVKLEIDCFSPETHVEFYKYEKSPTALKTSNTSFTEAQEIVYEIVQRFIFECNLK